VQSAPVKVQSAPRDTSVKPVKKKAPVIKKDSTGVSAPASVLKPAAPAAPVSTTTASVATVQKPVPAAPVATPDSAAKAAADSMQQQAAVPLHQDTEYDLYLKKLAATNIFLKSDKPTRLDVNKVRVYEDLDWLVYVMAGVVLLLGIIRLSYLKYFSDLFRAFMNPTLSQRQLKDQLSQSPFPNFLLNGFFVISLALYLYLLMYRQQYIPANTAWMAIPGLVVLVAAVYSVKYVMLRFCGWLFGSTELADAYIFILYLINKILGILLVPFLVILAFCKPEWSKPFMYMSVAFIVLLVAYRYIRSYSVVKQYLSFSRLHFFLYLCAFEVAPVLIITKVLLVALTGGL
jgi:hypothetical protein